MRAAKTPLDPISEAVALLRKGPTAPNDEALLNRIAGAIERAQRCQHSDTLGDDYEAKEKQMRAAAKAMLEALAAVQESKPLWASGEGLEDPERFEREVNILARMGERKMYLKTPEGYQFQGLGIQKKTRPKLPVAVVLLHADAREMLENAGLKASAGTGASVARLGALLCAAAGIPPKGNESTKAARLACSLSELNKYFA